MRTMGFLDRFFLALYALAVLLLSLGVAVLCTQLVPMELVWTNFIYLCGRWETVAGAAVFFLLSLRFLKVSLSVSKRPKLQKEAVIVRGEMGEVQVAVEAVRNMVDKTARSVRGVRDVKTEVTAAFMPSKKGDVAAQQQVKIVVKIVIGQESNVTEVSNQVRTLVGNGLTNVVGLSDFDLEVRIDDISNASVQKQRVV